ncbi:hypothetical protein FSP39_019569 [Pinctada imbricata]|uniref:Repressor of yield of DENV protein n=1 Tax=Pinctada imbricata TaxID=66713 RepID=A0AA88Y5U5_PINIB|nr:hypothetical protein FSP39_019569 [Pinctada imbricata]
MDISKKEQDRLISHIRELYHGRFDRQEVRKLLENHNWNQEETNDFIINSEPSVVRQLIHGKTEEELADILQNQLIISGAKSNRVSESLRQFACESCDHDWWTKVPDRKPVSECRKCRSKFDAIPREDEWGWAIFRCKSCKKEFSGFGQMNVTESECYGCHTMVMPRKVLPPSRRRDPKSESKHSCDAPDCTAHRNHGQGGDHKECVHPRSRAARGKRRVVLASARHVSTGSTVNSYTPDDDVISTRSISPTLESIHEDD